MYKTTVRMDIVDMDNFFLLIDKNESKVFIYFIGIYIIRPGLDRK
jgi:hypothetical protein